MPKTPVIINRKIIGYILTEAKKVIEYAYDKNMTKVGFYDKRSNKTFDAKSNVVGVGNQLAHLISATTFVPVTPTEPNKPRRDEHKRMREQRDYKKEQRERYQRQTAERERLFQQNADARNNAMQEKMEQQAAQQDAKKQQRASEQQQSQQQSPQQSQQRQQATTRTTRTQTRPTGRTANTGTATPQGRQAAAPASDN